MSILREPQQVADSPVDSTVSCDLQNRPSPRFGAFGQGRSELFAIWSHEASTEDGNAPRRGAQRPAPPSPGQ